MFPELMARVAKTLMATVQDELSSSAKKTSPIPPRPRHDSTRYLSPMSWPTAARRGTDCGDDCSIPLHVLGVVDIAQKVILLSSQIARRSIPEQRRIHAGLDAIHIEPDVPLRSAQRWHDIVGLALCWPQILLESWKAR